MSRYLKLPYIPTLTGKLINIICENGVRIAKVTCRTVGDSFFSRTKDVVNRMSMSSVVYKIPCANCCSCYVGTTSQYLRARIAQHSNDCREANRDSRKSALVCHHVETGHKFNFDEVRILDHCENYRKRMLLEMIHINLERDSVNFRTDSQGLSAIYSGVLAWSQKSKTVDHGSIFF